MKRLLFLALVLVSSAGLPAQRAPLSLDQCRMQLPLGVPRAQTPGFPMCRTAYATLNDLSARIPVWVAYVLEPKNAIGCEPRVAFFSADDSLPKKSRAEEKDYNNSGYDIGHMAPAADMSWSELVVEESFLLSNAAPQMPNLNRGIWKSLETKVRAWAYEREHKMLVYVGPIYSMGNAVIGGNRVIVPHAFYKIVVDLQTKETLAFVFPHHIPKYSKLEDYQVTVSDIEKSTGIRFPVPRNMNNVKLPIFTSDAGKLARDKRSTCELKTAK